MRIIEGDDRYLLLDRYLAGEASAADVDAVRAWLAEDAEHELLLDDLRLIRRVANARPPQTSVDAAWIRAVKALAPSPKPHVWRRLFMATGALTAAAAVVVLVGGNRVLRRGPQWKEYATAVGHRAIVRLRDGTQVTLAPKSRLRYTADYGSAHRNVYLDGQAYFQVAPDSQRPLRVHTAGGVTEDLATAFVVTAYADQRATEVVVAEGRVALWRRDSAPDAGRAPVLVLDVRDLGRLDPNGVATLRRGVDVARHLAWTTGVLEFDGTPLGVVVPELQRWYNVEIRLADSALATRRLTASFQHEPIDLVLNRIALTLGMRVERAEGSVYLLRIGS